MISEDEHNSSKNTSGEDPKSCISCQSLIIEEGYVNNLCSACRTKLLKHPIPRWVIVFFLVVTLFLGYGIFRFPAILGDGINMARAKKLEAEKKFVSAGKIYKELSEKHTKSSEILVRYYVCSYMNIDVLTCLNIQQQLVQLDTKDNDIINEANEITDKLSRYYLPSDGFVRILNDTSITKDSLIHAIENYVSCNPHEFYPVSALYDIYYDQRKFDLCIQITQEALNRDPEYIYGYSLLASAEREKGKLGEARIHANKILELQPESALGLISLGKIELKAGKNSLGLELIQRGTENYGQKDIMLDLNLALAYHFNQRQAEAEKLVSSCKPSNEEEKKYYLLIDSIIHNKIQWQIKEN